MPEPVDERKTEIAPKWSGNDVAAGSTRSMGTGRIDAEVDNHR